MLPCAPALGAGGRPDERPRLPAAVELPFGCPPPDDLQAPDGAREERVDLSLSPIAGESAALHPEFLPQVHVDHLVRALQMEYDAIWPGAAAKDLLQGLHLHRGGVAGYVEMDHLVADPRSEERRVGKECRSWWSPN